MKWTVRNLYCGLVRLVNLSLIAVTFLQAEPIFRSNELLVLVSQFKEINSTDNLM